MKNIMKDLLKTFYSRSFYTRLTLRDKGLGFGYIWAQAIIILLLPLCFALAASPIAYNTAKNIFEKLPEVTIKDQRISIDKASPYAINLLENAGEDTPVLLFDMSPHEANVITITEEMKQKRALVLVTPDFIAVAKDASTEIHLLKDEKFSEDQTINHDQWMNFFNKLLIIGIPVTIGIAFITFMGLVIVWTFLRAIIVTLAAWVLRIEMEFSDAFRISSASSVPDNFLFAMSIAASFALPKTISWGIWGAYALFALLCAKQGAKTPSSGDSSTGLGA